MATDEQTMAWMMDTYSMQVGHAVPEIVTGKPLSVGGSVLRPEATGIGVVMVVEGAVERLGWKLDGVSCVVQGYGKVGAVGFCLGGKLAYLLATRFNPDASVGYYGVGVENALDEIDHLRGALTLHIAEKDQFCPPEAQAKIHAALDQHPSVALYDYAGQDHAFARLGGRRIEARAEAAFLEEGTLAGSTLTMERAFRTLVTRFGSSIVEAATMCSTTPARELGLTGFGVIAIGAPADLTVLDHAFRVVRTFIAGEQVVGPALVQ